MNKKLFKHILIIICLFFVGIVPVFAKEDCTSIKSELDLYDSYEETLKNTDCTDTSDITIVNTCNETNQQKNLIISKIMKLNDENQICSSEKKRANKIIKDNKDNCGKIFDDDFNNFVKNVMAVFYVVAPILLILFGSLDFAKATVASDAAELKKASTTFAKRVAATLLLFLTPTLINLILSFNMTDKYLSGNAYTCNYKYSVFVKKYNIKYVASSNKSNKGSTYKRCTGPSCPTYIWPLDASSVYVTDPFGNRDAPVKGASSAHNGIDIGASYGGNVYAIADGTVVFAAYDGSAGNNVVIQSDVSTGETMLFSFMHNSQILVSVGDKVKQGDVIALAGCTGACNGTHSHLRVRDANTRISYNPLLYLYGGTTNIRTVDGSSIDLIKSFTAYDDWLDNYTFDDNTGTFSKVNNK